MGNNCVGGLQSLLSMAGINLAVASYMKPNFTAVYAYALAAMASYHIPTPLLVPPEVANLHNLMPLAGSITSYVGQTGDFAANSLIGLVSSAGSNADGTPNDAATANVTLTLNQSTHTATIDYSQAQYVIIYDQNGNVVGIQGISGPADYLAQDVVNALSDALSQLVNPGSEANTPWGNCSPSQLYF